METETNNPAPEVSVVVVEPPPQNNTEGESEWRGRMESALTELRQLATQITNLLAEMRAEFKQAQEMCLTALRAGMEAQQAAMTQSQSALLESLKSLAPMRQSQPETTTETPAVAATVEVATPANVPATVEATPAPVPETRKRKKFL